MARVLAALALFVSLATPAVAQEITGTRWMQLDATSRTMYVVGTWDGARSLAKGLGFDFVVEENITYEQASERLYRRLLREPEIRSRTLIDIMFATLPIVLTGRQENRIERSGR